MSEKILYRAIQGIITMWAVVTVVFFLMRISGDPVEMRFAGNTSPNAEQQEEALRHDLGLDRPIHEQYINYLIDVISLDFGKSISEGRSVQTIIKENLPYTLRLTLFAFVLSYLIAIPLGVLTAVWRNSPFDYGIQVLSMIGVSIPSFWLGIMLILLFAVQWELLPALGVGGGDIRHLILPAATIAIPRVSFMSRFVRGTMLDVLNEDYLRTARAKGLHARTVVIKHGLRNALIPIITVAGVQLGYLVSGSVVIERVFGLPGIGDTLVDSISSRDFPITQALVLIIALTIVIMNLAVDILYVYIDPRLRVE